MGYARKNLVSLNDTPYYHVIARCVRRAWLWGVDEYAGKDYSHRKEWVIERLGTLSSIFAVQVCAYAVMSNHYHLVLHVDSARAHEWTRDEVVKRWTRLFRAPNLVERWQSSEALEAECQAAEVIIEDWRRRLTDVSWFMRCLNEHLARRANAEDECTGRFWEGRFKSQALLDEAGLLTAMAYVDLNPVRAGIEKAPQDAPFTSVYQRIRELNQAPSQSTGVRIPLRPFANTADTRSASIPYSLSDYLQLIDWSGRVIRKDPSGAIDASCPPIIDRIGIDRDDWELLMSRRGRIFGRAMGKLNRLRLHAATVGQSWIRGVGIAARVYSR